MKFPALLFALASVVLAASGPAPAPARVRARPAEWAAPIIETTLDNCYRVSAELFRCEQPAQRDVPDIRALGIRTLLNLRQYHTDSPDFARAGLTLVAEQMSAGRVTVDQLVVALRKFRAAPKPVLVHCWHGSDRTGAFVAAYRIVFQDWTTAAAIDELRRGGFGFHESAFPNLVPLIETLDVATVKKRVME